MPEKKHHIVPVAYAGQTISVSLEFSQRKRLSITVHPDGSVAAKAPMDRSPEEVMIYLQRRACWIVRQRRHFERYQPLPEEKRYVSGETHFYLGRQYRLRVRQADGTGVKLIGRFLHVSVFRPDDPQMVKAVLDAWYQAHAAIFFQGRVKRYQHIAPFLSNKDIPLRIRPMKRRWGSCSPAGTITLNTDLIKTPAHCIEYVILHELCHLRVHDHSPAFFRLLSRYMPDWQKRKDRLELFILR